MPVPVTELREARVDQVAVVQRWKDCNAWYELARFFLKQNDLISAEAACKQGIRMGSRHALNLLCREIYWNRMQSAERIIYCLAEKQNLHCEDPALYFLLGLAFLREGMTARAESIFHRIYNECDAFVLMRLTNELKRLSGQSTPDAERAMRILSWFGLSHENLKHEESAFQIRDPAAILDLSGQEWNGLHEHIARMPANRKERIRLVDISNTGIRDLSPLWHLTALEELHCYAMTEPLGLLALVSLPALRRIVDHRSLNEWERHCFRKRRPDVSFL